MSTINNNPSAANRHDGLLVALGHLSEFLDEKEWSGLARDVREAARAISQLTATSPDIDQAALDVARRFIADDDPRRLAQLQVAVIEAIKRFAPAPGVGEAVAWQWRSRIKGGAWDAWENGRYGCEPASFMEVEHRALGVIHPSPVEAAVQKYDDVLLPFLAMMRAELHANAGKGDRPGWMQMDRKTALLEIFYHLAKLQKAAKDDDQDGIREYAADVANMSMMLVDVCGCLPDATQSKGDGNG